jgi:hypothetical protein
MLGVYETAGVLSRQKATAGSGLESVQRSACCCGSIEAVMLTFRISLKRWRSCQSTSVIA